MVADDALRVAGAILCESLALVIWNLGSRSPRRLLDDARASLASGRRALVALTILLLGTIFFTGAIVLVVPVLVDPPAEFSPLVIGTLLVALFVDFLVGDDLRGIVFTRRTP